MAGTLLAADAFEGTWKLNSTKSKVTQGAAPKEETIVIARQGEDYLIKITGTDPSGAPFSIRYSAPTNGGEGKILEGPYDSISTKRIDPYTRENRYTKDGKEVRFSRGAAGKDGKSLMVTVKGTDAAGKPFAGTLAFDRQPGS